MSLHHAYYQKYWGSEPRNHTVPVFTKTFPKVQSRLGKEVINLYHRKMYITYYWDTPNLEFLNWIELKIYTNFKALNKFAEENGRSILTSREVLQRMYLLTKKFIAGRAEIWPLRFIIPEIKKVKML